MVESITDDIREEDGIAMTSWIIDWYRKDQEGKKRLRGNMETTFNYLLDIQEVMGKNTKYR